MIKLDYFFNKTLRFALILLILSCIFDPANKILGLKMPFFIFSWFIFGLKVILCNKGLKISNDLFIFLLMFVLVIPVFSLFYYAITNGNFSRFDGFTYLKTYLFLSVVIILYHSEIDLLKPTVKILTVLSVITLIFFIIGYFNTSFLTLLESKIGGKKYDLARIGIRNIFGINFKMVYFETSPLIVFSIGYFTYRVIFSHGFGKLKNIFLLGINIIAMFVGATRNNMFASLITPLAVFYWYTRKKIIFLFIAITFLMVFIGSNFEEINRMLDAREASNKMKISFYNDYLEILKNADVLIFGQGMGSYFDSPRGSVSNSELTYFEIIRRFGLILSLVIFGLLLYPFHKMFSTMYHEVHFVYISYFFYLLMCFSNPLLLSSTGMLFLSFVLYVTFQKTEGKITVT
jgi:hypothetical protein